MFLHVTVVIDNWIKAFCCILGETTFLKVEVWLTIVRTEDCADSIFGGKMFFFGNLKNSNQQFYS